jgi:exodeoxyribonuclease VII large subunit
MPAETLTVSDLARDIQAALDQLGGEVWVQGELHGLRRTDRGHVWFDLVEVGTLGGPPVAQIPVVLFDRHRRGVNALLKRTGGVRMTDGMAIRIRADVEFYPPQGRVQLVMTGIDPEYTLGTLLAERDRVLQVLRQEALLGRNGLLAAPAVPLRVGLVTAAGSAAYADFVHELERSRYAFRVVHHDARVQGREAEQSIAAALRTLGGFDLDVVALVRGGGARTDLACFDGERVARAIAALPVPVVTGIGHETDRSIADEVAHTAHKTPTACAAALVATVDRFLAGLREQAATISHAARQCLEHEHARLGAHAERATRAGTRRLDREQAHLARRAERVTVTASHTLTRHHLGLADAVEEIGRRADHALARADRQLTAHEARARALDPARLLARGWTITRSGTGEVVRAADLAPGTELVTRFVDGSVRSTVVAVEPDEPTAGNGRPDAGQPTGDRP